MSRRNVALLAAVAAGSVVLVACTPSHARVDAKAAARQPHSAARATLNGSELHYGAGAKRSSEVVYEPDVVTIGEGAGAVRSGSANGLVWTIDAHAAGASDLAVGKIMLITSLGTGRVLKLTHKGSEDVVVLGPVSLTDVFRQVNIRSAAPIALANPLYYATPGLPGGETTDRTTKDAPDSGHRRLLSGGVPPHRRLAPTLPVPPISPPSLPPIPTPPPLPISMPAPTTSPQSISTGEATTQPFLNAAGLGAQLSVQHGDGRFVARVTLHLNQPTADFVLDIEDGVVKEASVHLHGAGAISIDITAADLSSNGQFAERRIQIPVSLVIPLGGPAPLYLSITQGFLVTSQLLGKAEVQTHGTYRLIGDLYFGIRNGKPLLSATTAAVVDPMNRNTVSLGVAANSVGFGWRVTAEVGVGLLGFSAGAWYKLGFFTEFTADGLDVLHPGCVTNSIVIRGQFGVGYHVPEVVMKAVNFFLGVFGVKKIPASGGLMSKYVPLWHPDPAQYCP
jgi:hypothetical protein